MSRPRVEVTLRLSAASYGRLGQVFWEMAATPGLDRCTLEWFPGISHTLVLAGSRRAVRAVLRRRLGWRRGDARWARLERSFARQCGS